MAALTLAQVLACSDVPGGVVNIVTGPRDDLALALASHDGVSAIWHAGQGEGLAMLTLPLAAQPDLAQGWLMHPALMDIATGWAMGLISGYRPDHLWVPGSYGRVRAWGPLPARVHSWVRNAAANRGEGPVAVFDITLTDGTNLHLMPAQSGKGLSKSRPIPKKLVPAYVKRLTAKGDLKITAATEK